MNKLASISITTKANALSRHQLFMDLIKFMLKYKAHSFVMTPASCMTDQLAAKKGKNYCQNSKGLRHLQTHNTSSPVSTS